ncbi:MAG: hypothetical protein JNM66_04270 [Bryobacterales bacterium]|nr:hypothetical protein [Bryobacterales bacterium]
MGRRVTILFLLLVLLVAPAANAWCSTVCLAAAISSGCAHGLQPSDDLPVQKSAAAIAFVPFAVPVTTVFTLVLPEIPHQPAVHQIPLRI